MSEGPPKKQPEGIDINWVTQEVGWGWPTWIEPELFADEFAKHGIERTPQLGQHLTDLLASLDNQIAKGLATSAGDLPSITFKYWRKLSDRATKMKPTKLKATLYAHPAYGNVWLYVERA